MIFRRLRRNSSKSTKPAKIAIAVAELVWKEGLTDHVRPTDIPDDVRSKMSKPTDDNCA